MKDRFPLTLLYDGACPVCSLEIEHLRQRDQRQRLKLIDIAAPGFDPAAYGSTMAALSAEIVGLRPDGERLRGLAALREAYAAVGLAWVLHPTGWGPLKPAFDLGYRWFARYRRPISVALAPLIYGVRSLRARRMAKSMRECGSGACSVKPSAEPGAAS